VYKLSAVGQALEKNDLSAAGSVLGGSTDADWVQRANIAFNKVSLVPEYEWNHSIHSELYCN